MIHDEIPVVKKGDISLIFCHQVRNNSSFLVNKLFGFWWSKV